MSETVLVLHASRYEFPNEKTGELIKGVKVHYVSDYTTATQNSVGEKPMTISASFEVFDEIKKHGAPAMYEIQTRTKPGKEGKAEATLTHTKFVREVSIAQLR